MVTVRLAAAEKRTPIIHNGRHAQRIERDAFVRVIGDGGTVRENNHALECLDFLGNGFRRDPMPDGWREIFWIDCQIDGVRMIHGHKIATYNCDYHRENGCPVEISEEFMRQFAILKRNCESNREEGRRLMRDTKAAAKKDLTANAAEKQTNTAKAE